MCAAKGSPQNRIWTVIGELTQERSLSNVTDVIRPSNNRLIWNNIHLYTTNNYEHVHTKSPQPYRLWWKGVCENQRWVQAFEIQTCCFTYYLHKFYFFRKKSEMGIVAQNITSFRSMWLSFIFQNKMHIILVYIWKKVIIYCRWFTQYWIQSPSVVDRYGHDRGGLPKPAKCDVCGKMFATLWHMRRHHLTHTKEKPFPCDVCSKGFTTKQNLDCHRRVHTGEKPYTCYLCGKAFRQHSTLKHHVSSHEMPPMWDYNGKDFNYVWVDVSGLQESQTHIITWCNRHSICTCNHEVLG